MILELSCSNHHATVEVTASAGVRRVRLDGKDVSFDWVSLSQGQYSLILDDRVYDFFIDFSEGSCLMSGRHGLQTLRVSDARSLLRQKEVEEGRAGLQQLSADMPGKVVRLMVKEGDEVSFDQGLLVLEAMKMQNEIRAPKSGVIRSIGVTPGTAVNTGQFLLSLE